jgi:hypothetical protein
MKQRATFVRLREITKQFNKGKIMIGTMLVTLLVAAIVSSYMTIVNRMLRTDEHWSESNQLRPATKPAAALRYPVTGSLAHA